MTYIYLEMPNFRKTEAELKTRLDKWLYFIRHLEDSQTIPMIFKDEVFTQAFEKAELARFGQAELDSYENNLKSYRDLKGVIDTAFEEGQSLRNIEVAKTLKKRGVSMDIIIEATGLSESGINNL